MKARDRFLPTVKGRPEVWDAQYRAVYGPSMHDAIETALIAARKDVPSASTEVVAIKKTPTGRWTVTIRRTLSKETENA